jgi:hypothetical protein
VFNRVLRELSPTRSDAFDEFDAVGLYHQRHTHDWAKLAGSWPQIAQFGAHWEAGKPDLDSVQN